MRVYIAARYSRREEASFYATVLREAGHIVTSDWHEETQYAPTVTMKEIPDADLIFMANRDIEQLANAGAVLFLSESPEQPIVRGARHVEFGYALAMAKRIIVIGPKENIFHYLPSIEHAPRLAEALDLLARCRP